MSYMEKSPSREWVVPLVVVVAVHLGLAAIPLHFSTAHSQESPPQVQIKLTPVQLPEPEPIVEAVVPPAPMPPAPQPPPPPMPEPKPVVARAPEARPVEPVVAVVEEIQEPLEEEIEPLEAPIEYSEDSDSDYIDELAALYAAATPEQFQRNRPVPTAQPSTQAEPVDWQTYGQKIIKTINKEQRYPRMAARRGLEGTATVRIFIHRDGTLARRPDIVASTNHDILDREALRMIESAAPFDAFPGSAEDEEQEFVIPVRFRLEG